MEAQGHHINTQKEETQETLCKVDLNKIDKSTITKLAIDKTYNYTQHEKWVYPPPPTPNPHFRAIFWKFLNLVFFLPPHFKNWRKNLHTHIEFHSLQLSTVEKLIMQNKICSSPTHFQILNKIAVLFFTIRFHCNTLWD